MSTMTFEKRIYVVVADVVTGKDGVQVTQPLGRRVAQVAHAVSKVRFFMAIDFMLGLFRKKTWKQPRPLGFLFQPITTIVLSCRDSRELLHIQRLLTYNKIKFEEFLDTNQPDYGDPNLEVRTAVATHPVEIADVVGITDYLPLLTQ